MHVLQFAYLRGFFHALVQCLGNGIDFQPHLLQNLEPDCSVAHPACYPASEGDFFFFFKSVFAYGLDHGKAMSPPEGGPYRLERGAKENYLMKRQKKQHSIAVIGPHTSINTNQYTGVKKAFTKLPPQNPSYPTHIPQQYVFCPAS